MGHVTAHRVVIVLHMPNPQPQLLDANKLNSQLLLENGVLQEENRVLKEENAAAQKARQDAKV